MFVICIGDMLLSELRNAHIQMRTHY